MSDVLNKVFSQDGGLDGYLDKMKEENPFNVYKSKENADFKYSGATTLDTIGTAFKDESFIAMGANYIYNKQKDDTFDIDVNFNVDNEKEMFEASGIKREDVLSKIKDRARNKEHLEELLKEGKEFEYQLDALDNSFGGGFFQRGLALTTDMIPLLATAPVSVAGRLVFASNKARRMLTGVAYEGVLEAGKREWGERERSVTESVVSVALGGLANVAFGKSFKEAEELRVHINDIIRTTTNMSKEDVKVVEELVKNKKFKEAEDVVTKKIKEGKEDDFKISSLVNLIDRKQETMGMTENVYNKLRGDLAFLLQHSHSDKMSRLANQFFDDATLKRNTPDKLYGAREAIEIKESLLGVHSRAFNELHKEWRDAYVEVGEKKNFGRVLNGLIETFSESRDVMYHYAGRLHHMRANNIEGLADDAKALDYMASKLVEDLKFKRTTAEKLAGRMMKSSEELSLKQFEVMRSYGAEKFLDDSIKQDKFYMPNQYRRGVYDDLLAQGFKGDDISDMLARSFINGQIDKAMKAGKSAQPIKNKFETLINGKNEDFDKLKLAMKRFIRSVSGDNIGAKRLSDANIKSDDFTDAMAEAFGKDKEIMDMLNIIDGGAKSTGKEIVIFQKNRKSFDRSYSKKYPAGNLSFIDLLENNVEALSTQYAKKMSGRTALEKFIGERSGTIDGKLNREFNLRTEEDIETFFKDVQKEINNANISKSKKASEIERARHTLKQLMGDPTIDSPDSMSHQIVDIMNNLTIGLKLGGGALPMIAEYTNMVMKFGIREFMNNAGIGRDIQSILTTGKVKDGLAKDMYQYLEVGKELGEGFLSIRQEANMNPFTTANIVNKSGFSSAETFINTAHKFSSKFASSTLLLSGMKPLHSFGQAVFGATIINKFLSRRLGQNADLDKFFRKEMNLSDEMFTRIQNQFKKHSSIKTLKSGQKVDRMNADKWDDTEAFFAFRHGIKRVLDTYIQRSHLGDEFAITIGSRLLSDTFYGRAFLNLKNYMITSYTKQLGRMTFDFDRKQALTASAQLTSVATLVYTQSVMNNIGNEDGLKDALSIGNFTNSVISKLSFSSYIPILTGGTEALLTGSSGYSNTLPIWGLNTMLPQMTMVKDMAGIARVPYNIVSGKPDEIGKDALNLTVNYPWAKPAINYLKSELKDARNNRVSQELKTKKAEEKYEEIKERLGL